MGGVSMGDKHMAAASFAVGMLWVALGGPVLSFLMLALKTPCKDLICGTEGSLGSQPMFAI